MNSQYSRAGCQALKAVTRARWALAMLLGWLVAGCIPTPVTPGVTPTLASTITSTSIPLPSVTATLPSLPTRTQRITSSPVPTASSTSEPIPTARFAVIGDYGLAGQPEADVAALIDSWQVDFVITVGDNNYPYGFAGTIDANIGQYFHTYIGDYKGGYGEGSPVNRFFPTLGNHDWIFPRAAPYLAYFTLPGNERYYNFTWGPVEFFAIDSDEHEPDGFRKDSAQAVWLKDGLAASIASWKIVYFHHAPYSSGEHGASEWMRWPFEQWGASAVLSGHDHTYERLQIGAIPFFVNGLGGGAIYNFTDIADGSLVRYNDDWGAMLVQASPGQIRFQFYTRKGELIDDTVLGTGTVYLPLQILPGNPLFVKPLSAKRLDSPHGFW
jgi:tartrate-resistant acid phosphatase type 5